METVRSTDHNRRSTYSKSFSRPRCTCEIQGTLKIGHLAGSSNQALKLYSGEGPFWPMYFIIEKRKDAEMETQY